MYSSATKNPMITRTQKIFRIFSLGSNASGGSAGPQGYTCTYVQIRAGQHEVHILWTQLVWASYIKTSKVKSLTLVLSEIRRL